MSLSRKHFKAIAKILNNTNATYEIINQFADYCQSENNLFDRNKFVDACTIKGRVN